MATKKSAVNDDLLTSEIMKLVSPETGTHDRQVTLLYRHLALPSARHLTASIPG
jgi:hypothetical protein